jgi:hypothetical protein
MHTVELLAEALDLAARLGWQVRQDWLDGNGGGLCELRGRKIFFLDLALAPADQLDQALDALRRDPAAPGLPMVAVLRDLLAVRKSA